ncbi:response regulator [Xylophilus sp.]|uniref:response regulator n=1 Tax=Xylophilus sp. TaxID=2653893 RepID=UPI0013BA9BC4|nr:response regulator [Xylophilus sp.]KAF1043346.1 MAG: Transcriptional regulatory protein BaeR [Xylophilus sp.]
MNQPPHRPGTAEAATAPADAQRILVVEDEPDIASVLVDYLRHAGFAPEHVADGLLACDAVVQLPPALVLLDVMLPGCSGLEVLRKVRSRGDTPVIMLTARVEEIDRLLGLELGADDYVCKPFSPREVVARVRAVLRRHAVHPNAAPHEGLVLDAAQWRASLHGASLALTPREFALLQVLDRQRGRVFSRRQLLELAYPDDLEVTERAIDSHVKNLRRKLAPYARGHEWLRAVYGVGFALEEPEG